MTTATGEPTIDLLEDTWAERIPHAEMEWLRQNRPVHWHDGPASGEGFWCLTKWSDVREVSRQPRTFSVELGSPFIETHDEESLRLMALTLVSMDPPKHDRMRRLVSAGFTPRMIGLLEHKIAERAVHIVDSVIEEQACDFVQRIAAELPLQVICEMIGVPEEDRHLVFEWSNTLVGQQDPDFNRGPGAGEVAMAQMYAYCDRIAADRRIRPRDDIMSTLVHAEVDGDRLSPEEIDMFFVTLAVAGNETTRNLIAHSMQALFDHPEARAELQSGLDDQMLWKSATEEFLRWGSSIVCFRRTAAEDTQVHGQPIRAGEKVVLYYISANRDEDVFVDPYRFDIRRNPNEHQAFGGGGIHYCLGANLARLEIRSMMQEVLRRLPDIRPDGEPARLRSNFINGIKRMPVRWD